MQNSGIYKWQKHDKSAIKGFIYDSNGNLINSENFLSQIIPLVKNMQYSEVFNKFYGHFSFIINNDNYFIICVDKIRSFPIFYIYKDRSIILSDSARSLLENCRDKSLDEDAVNEFLKLGYVTGTQTLIKELKQLKAGQCLVYDKKTGSLEINKYYQFLHKDSLSGDEEKLFKMLDNVHERVFSRLFNSLNGRQVAVPLSSGLDSRLIIFMLKKLGYSNVVAYTFGRPDNFEAVVSRKISDKLGYKWLFVDYSLKKWYQWYHSEERKKFSNYADNLTAIAHLLEWPTVNFFKTNRVLNDDCIFIPGHTGDFITGMHIPEWFLGKKYIYQDELLDSIIKKHYNLYDWTKKSPKDFHLYKQKILSIIEEKDIYSPDEAANNFELWEWQERQAKFICNAVREYEFYNYEWRLPFWDGELMDFWCNIPLRYRIKRNLFHKYMLKYYSIETSSLSPVIKNIRRKKRSRKIYDLLSRINKVYIFLRKLKIFFNYYHHHLALPGVLKFYEYIKYIIKYGNDVHITLFIDAQWQINDYYEDFNIPKKKVN
ncbi:MAG: hypothetical protein JXR46_00445 [Calditrichaceae bacterium]|nr:hypothetical protein [Calditrichaceae bacterium]MBN2707482.1 hypothetical protein [Calditrichaceae bacterium]RQV95572.1 MAG: asparagine synthetase B family protein [Calditrichota bacterium]